MPLENRRSQLGDRSPRAARCRVEVGPGLLGRVIDGFGKPMDKGPASKSATRIASTAQPPTARPRAHPALVTGIRAIDALCLAARPAHRHLRGSGVGKRALLGSMSRHNSADVTVIAMIATNAKSAAFSKMSSAEAKRSIVVCATSEHLPAARARLLRRLAISEYFATRGPTCSS